MEPSSEHPKLSVVIPVFNEAANLEILHQTLSGVLSATNHTCEIIYVDDGSSDHSAEILEDLATAEAPIQVRPVRLCRNYGQTTAFSAGIDHARGDIIILMDGDLQNDPKDIPALLLKLEEGFDVVSGWRQKRRDLWLTKKLPSWVANHFISFIGGVKMRDYGCSLKAYRREILKGFRLYGEMHRFIPIYAYWQGARITEIPVRHHARQQGKSHYGLSRTFKVLMDLIVVIFLHQYQQKPMYIFGGTAMVSFTIGFFAGLMAVYYKFFGNKTFIETPLPLLCVLCFLAGLICFLMGLLAELLIRIYYESQNKPTYQVRKD